MSALDRKPTPSGDMEFVYTFIKMKDHDLPSMQHFLVKA